MPAIIACDSCGTKLHVRDGFTARVARCSKCGNIVDLTPCQEPPSPAPQKSNPRPRIEPVVDGEPVVPEIVEDDDESPPIKVKRRQPVEPEDEPEPVASEIDEADEPPVAKVKRRRIEPEDADEPEAVDEDIDEPRPRKKKKKNRRKKGQAEGGSGLVVWFGGMGAVVLVAALAIPILIKSGHLADVIGYGISLAIMVPISTGILILSMIISSHLGGGIDFGEARTAILKAAGLLLVVNLIYCIPVPHPILLVPLVVPVWWIGLMILFGLDFWEVRFLVFINWLLNSGVRFFLLMLILNSIMNPRAHDTQSPDLDLEQGPVNTSQPKEDLDWVKSLGGHYFVNEDAPGAPVETIGFTSSRVTDADLARLKVFPSLKVLMLGNTEITNAGLQHLKNLKTLEELELSNTAITDTGLKNLNGLTNLQHLELSGTKVTAAGMLALRRALPRLQITMEQ